MSENPRAVPADRLNALNMALADLGLIKEKAQKLLADAKAAVEKQGRAAMALHDAIVKDFAIAPTEQYSRLTGVITPREVPKP